MTTDRTEQLIVDLVADMSPVRRLPPVSVRTLRWLAFSVAVSALAVWIIGIRHDLSRAMTAPDVLWSLGLALVASTSAALLALRLSVPGTDQSRWVRWLPIMVVAAWVAMLLQLTRAAGVFASALWHEPFHAACVVRVVAIAVIPTLLLVRELRRGFALDATSAAALAALGGSAIAALAVQLVCPIDRAAHLLASHVVPVGVLMIAGAAAARAVPRVLRPVVD